MRAFVICPKTFVRDYLLYFTYFNYFDVYKNVFKKYSEALPGEQQIFKFKSFLLKKFSAKEDFIIFTDVHVADNVFVFLVAKAASKSVVQNAHRHLLKKVNLSDA